MPSCSPKTDGDYPWTEQVLPTCLDIIPEAETGLLSALEDLGYDEDHWFAVRLALEEALVNAMKHGNRMDPSRKVRMAYRIAPDRVDIRVRDEGQGFNPRGVPDPTIDENLRRPCGRGIMLMRSYMDSVRFSCGGNEVHMVKYRQPRQGGMAP